MYIRNKKMQNGKNYYVIEDRVKKREKYITIHVRYLGTAKKVLTELKALDCFREEKP